MIDTTSSNFASWLTQPLVLASLAGGVLLAVTIALWAKFGTAVFFETIVAGLNACF